MSSRLQGHDWYDYRCKHSLKLVCLSKSKDGRYRVDVLDENNKHFYHWLHPIEAKNLEKSNWCETHTIYELAELYKNNLLGNLIGRLIK